MLFPSEARAELIDIANTPGIVITDYAYPVNSTGVTEGTTLYNDIRANLTCNPYTTDHNGPTDYSNVVPFQHVLRETVPTHAITSASEASHTNLGYEMMRSQAAWTIPTKQAILAYVSFDLFENPLPAGSRLTFDGFQAPWLTNSVEYDNKGAWDYNGGTGTADRVYVWYSNSRYANNAKLANYDSTLGFYEIPETARYLYVSFRLRWRDTPTASEKQYRIYYENRLHMYWQVIGNDTISTNNTIDNQTDTLMNTDGSDTIVTTTSLDGQVEQIEGISLWESLEGIGEQLKQAVTTTESDTTVVFPAFSLMGFSLPTATVDIWQYSPIPQNTVRGFLTFVFVVWYIRYMYALIEQIFALRFYGYDGEMYDLGSEVRNGSADSNWGLVE